MKALLDTHALLWMVSESKKLTRPARAAIADESNELFFSIAGYWEIGIKQSLGKLSLTHGWQEALPKEMTRNGISFLPVEPVHIHGVAALPWIHRDPFDRLMVAQAHIESMAIISRDSQLSGYGVPIIW